MHISLSWLSACAVGSSGPMVSTGIGKIPPIGCGSLGEALLRPLSLETRHTVYNATGRQVTLGGLFLL